MITQNRSLPLTARWMHASGKRAFDEAELIFRQLTQSGQANDAALRGTARLYERLERHTDALPLWTQLRDANAADFEPSFHLARSALTNGASPAQAAAQAAPAAGEIFRDAIAEALVNPLPVLEGEFRHIAICGVSFCGSTLLDRVLGGLPQVKSIGESHWLTKVRADNAYREVDMSIPAADARFVPCTVCGKNCTVLSHDFRRSLTADGTNWYRKIAARLETRILVSADKNLPKLIEKDPLLELSALVLFKSPVQAWRSKLDKLPPDGDEAFYEEECRKYLAVWTRSYRAYLDHFRPQGAVAFLNFDAFTAAPERLLRATCAALAIPFDEGVLHRTEPGHAIGGNGRAMKRLRDKDYGVAIEALPDPALLPAQAAIIAQDADAQQTWRDLMARHDMMELQAPSTII